MDIAMDAESLRPVARTLLRTYQVRSARSKNLAIALSKGTACSWGDGEKICEEGGASDSMFVIIKGSVRVVKKDIKGIEKELATLPPPSMIGQMGLVDGSLRSATCLASGEVGALLISEHVFNQLRTEASPAGSAFRHLLLSTMMSQLSSANQKIRDLISDMENEQNQSTKAEEKPTTTDEKEPVAEPQKPKGSSSERLLKIAGVLDGWNIQEEDIENLDVELYEDEDMKRTREARDIAKKHRW
jgi:CRP-like cAMP-binding protein